MESGSALERNRSGSSLKTATITLQNKNWLTALSRDQDRAGQSSPDPAGSRTSLTVQTVQMPPALR